jgi:transposase
VRLAEQKGALILFGDEAGFAQWGSLSYTWAPKGQQPLVKTCGKRKAYKVFGLIEYGSGRLFWQGQTERFTTASYQAFLAEVLAQTQQHIILIQDGARYHTSQAMHDFFATHAARLTKFQLPAYSPDFNPIEHLWKKVKKHATHLKYFATFDALTAAVDKTLHQLENLPSEILSLMGRYCDTLGANA